jgi:hypothetical protein
MFAILFEKQFIELLKIELNNIQLQSITNFYTTKSLILAQDER